MNKRLIIFSGLFIALTTMPVVGDNKPEAREDNSSDMVKNLRKETPSAWGQQPDIKTSEPLILVPASEAVQPVTVGSTATAKTITVTGTVTEEGTEDPLYGAYISVLQGNTTIYQTTADENGKFTLQNVPANAKLKISFTGKTPITIDAQQTVAIKLEDSQTNKMKEIVAKSTYTEGAVCAPVDAKYAQHARGKYNERGNMRGQYKKINDEWKCVPTDCEQDYELKNNFCVKKQCTDDQLAEIFAATGTIINNICVPKTCTRPEYTLKDNKCTKTKCSAEEIAALKAADKNATTGVWKDGKCIPVCNIDYILDTATNKCVKGTCEDPAYEMRYGECVKVKCTTEDIAALNATNGEWDIERQICVATECDEKIYTLKGEICDKIDKRTKEEKEKALQDKQDAYDAAHAKEQSTANKTLTALTTAATGIGGMQLAQGLAEKSADRAAEQDMAAYIATMRCGYADGKSVTAGSDEIELPGANNQELMNLRREYLALAADLKERKNAMGIKPGIESEEILDRATSGLYDDENTGVNGGTYASLYRASALNSETDQALLADQQKSSSNRVKAGAIVAGAGVVGGIVGNAIINRTPSTGKETTALLKIEEDALKDLKKCLKSAGVKETDNLTFTNFYPSLLVTKNVNCDKNLVAAGKTLTASQLFNDSTDPEKIINSLNDSFGATNMGKLINLVSSRNIKKEEYIQHMKIKIEAIQKKFKAAADKDKKTADKAGINIDDLSGLFQNGGLSSLASTFGGDTLSNITGAISK